MVGIPDRTALLRAGDGTMELRGSVCTRQRVFLNGELTEGLSTLGG